jgi:hypothetical protein
MKRIVVTFIVLASVVIPAAAQKIASETGDRTHIVHLRTALNHLTVIEVAEPVVQVAAGSPSFKVEWRENKVFVQPTEIGEASNLFIWTANQRLNYELEPAGPVASMDFAIDQAPAHTEPLKPATASVAPAPSITELLLAGKPVRLLPSKQRGTKPVEVWISDLYEKDGRLLIRYAVRQRTLCHPHARGLPVERGAHLAVHRGPDQLPAARGTSVEAQSQAANPGQGFGWAVAIGSHRSRRVGLWRGRARSAPVE